MVELKLALTGLLVKYRFSPTEETPASITNEYIAPKSLILFLLFFFFHLGSTCPEEVGYGNI